MFSDVFLAMTGNEMQQLRPAKAAYMACHFSPYGKGLSNLPTQLPENSLLLLDDSTPIAGHSPNMVTEQLNELVARFSPKAVLLDFQRQYSEDAHKMIVAIVQNSSCPVAVSEKHSAELDCPVLLPPPPANKPLQDYLASFLQRGIYLEIAPVATKITVTANGSKTSPIPLHSRALPFQHKRLCCHYSVQASPGKAVFTLHRTGDDLVALSRQAYSLGVLGVVGLHQELSRLCAE